MTPQKEPSELRKLGLFGIIVSEIVGFTTVGWWGAHRLREWKGLPLWVEAAGIIVGFSLSLLQIWKQVKNEEK